MKNFNKAYIYLVALFVMGLTACEDDKDLPTISSDPSSFVQPVLQNDPAGTPVEFTAENADQEYEEFTWSASDFGVNLPVKYYLQMATSDDFTTNTFLVRDLSQTSASVTVDDFNDAMLGLGLPAFAESTVRLRVLGIVVGVALDTTFSETINRTATTFQLSDCGDFCSIGIIGDATPGGWDNDTDMRLSDPTGVDKNAWTATLYLTAGMGAKFRAMDDWGNNWGSADFPSGTGTQDGANITIDVSGYYKVNFNAKTFEYNFTLLGTPTFGTIGIIGDATAGGWDADTDLTQDATNAHVWGAVVTLTDGEVKFRADDDWANNWGETTFPSGFGVGGGPNIPVTAGTYYAWFNDATGEYALMRSDDAAPFATIGVIGTATPDGWDSDTDLIQNPSNPYRWSKVIDLVEGEAKFRADDDWANDWGSSAFPSGIANKGGDNFPVKQGKYVLHFHTGTGEYYFLK